MILESTTFAGGGWGQFTSYLINLWSTMIGKVVSVGYAGLKYLKTIITTLYSSSLVFYFYLFNKKFYRVHYIVF